MFRKQEWDSEGGLNVITVNRAGQAQVNPSVRPAAEAPSSVEPKPTEPCPYS